MAAGEVRIGCAGWSLPRDTHPRFAAEGPHLQRYASRLGAVEINSSFHRPHSRTTYERWAGSVPESFRFSVKLPRTVTHELRLQGCAPLVDEFLAQAGGLGPRLGCLLVQLPPSFAFDEGLAQRFFRHLRLRWTGAVSAEPRHATWFAPAADALLSRWRIARVLADPVLHAPGALPGGWPGLAYLRLHGTPRVYYSSYGDDVVAALARRIAVAKESGVDTWCIFDNTASGAAVNNALDLAEALATNHE